MSRTAFIAAGAVVLALSVTRDGGFRGHGPIDAIAFVLFCLLMVWLLGPRRNRDEASGHQGSDNLIAFRLGKALNRIRARRKA